MKFGICNETFVDWPLERAFAYARQLGYTGIEIAPFTLAADARQITPAQRAQVRRLADQAELEVIGLHWLLAKTQGLHLTSPDPAVRQATSEYLTELVRLCGEVGGSLLVFGSPLQRQLLPGVSPEQGQIWAAEVFSRIVPELERCDAVLAIEPLGPAEGNFLNTAAEAVELIERIGSPQCRLHLDTKAMSSEATPIPQLIRRHRDLLAHFHANDPNRQGPGFGELDFRPIFQALAEIDYRGWVSVEVFDYTPGVERLAEESLSYMENCLSELLESGGPAA